jgi:hypothetical protein
MEGPVTSSISRRQFFIAASAVGMSSLATAVNAAPHLPASSPHTYSVDVDRLRSLGLGSAADWLRSAMTDELRNAFPTGVAQRKLIVRLTSLTLSSYAGRGSRSGHGSGGGGDTDYLEGEILIVSARGETVGRHPQLLALPSSSGGAWYRADNERERIDNLARAYVYWLARTIR